MNPLNLEVTPELQLQALADAQLNAATQMELLTTQRSIEPALQDNPAVDFHLAWLETIRQGAAAQTALLNLQASIAQQVNAPNTANPVPVA